MEKLKIVHIHTDPKFLHCTALFVGESFHNTVIQIEQENGYKKFFDREELVVVKPNQINHILSIAKDSDLVVLYDLDFIKSRIALLLPEKVKVAWRFFGYELYGKNKRKYLSSSSIRFDEWERSLQKEGSGSKALRKIFYYLRYGNAPDVFFERAIARIDYMLALSREEYEELSTFYFNLPKFIKISLKQKDSNNFLKDFSVKEIDKRKIVVGNGRNAYNNHLDILKIVERSSRKADYCFELLFNYGTTGEYSEAVEEFVQGKQHYHLVENFIPPQEFQFYYQDISALVINSYRQLASANIFLAIENGTKIYLNRKNAHFWWLKNEGFEIFTIENFEEDLESGKVFLDSSTAKRNQEQLIVLSTIYSKENFQNNIYSKLVAGESS